MKIQKDWVEWRPKIYFPRQPSTKYLEQNKNSSKTGQIKKFDIYSCFFLDCSGQNLIFGKET